MPATGYLAGETSDFTLALSGKGHKGFQASPQNLTGALMGSLITGAGNQLVGSNKYVIHISASNAATASWNFQWKAPTIQGTGDATMYIADVMGQPNVRLS